MAGLFRRQKDDNYYHTGYSVEDLHSNQPIVVAADSVIVGDIYSPQVIVAGMVYGYIVAGEVIIQAAGQIWGDIFATSISALPGSKVHGWISSMDEGTVDLLSLGQLTIEEVPRSGELATSADRISTLAKLIPQFDYEINDGAERVEIWQDLRSEAATAISARVELERSFEAAVLETAERLKSGEQIPGVSDIAAGNKQSSTGEAPSIEPDVTKQLLDAETEVGHLRSQLTTALRRHDFLSTQLIWTKAALELSSNQMPMHPADDEADVSGMTDSDHEHQIAKLRATIAERDQKLQALQAKIEIREDQLSRLKTLAASRIEMLEHELDKIKLQQKK